MDFSEYVAARRPTLVRTAVLLGCPSPDAEDVVQTALLRSWCLPVGKAVGTEPAAGSRLDLGSTVELQLSANADGVCVDDSVPLAAALLAFADGRGEHPPLADSITVYDENGSAEITAAQAADPEAWRACSADDVCTAVLADLSAAAHAFYLAPGSEESRYVSPVLTASTQHHSCPYNAGPDLGRFSVRIQVLSSKDGPVCTDTAVDVYRDSDDRIDAVVLRTLGSTAVATSPIEDLAHQLVDFAQGNGDLPSIGNEVDLYVGGAFTGLVTQDSTTDRQAWETCTETGTYAGRDCPFSPLEVLRHEGQAVELTPDRIPRRCLPSFDDPSDGIDAADSITIVPANTGYGMCLGFAVQLYVNADNELIAVDLLLPEKI
jgi:hypothetical protein